MYCHICKKIVAKVFNHYHKKHPEQRRYKLYSPDYNNLCHYKNCWNFWQADGYCITHRGKV